MIPHRPSNTRELCKREVWVKAELVSSTTGSKVGRSTFPMSHGVVRTSTEWQIVSMYLRSLLPDLPFTSISSNGVWFSIARRRAKQYTVVVSSVLSGSTSTSSVRSSSLRLEIGSNYLTCSVEGCCCCCRWHQTKLSLFPFLWNVSHEVVIFLHLRVENVRRKIGWSFGLFWCFGVWLARS